jgi:hypothetical protein
MGFIKQLTFVQRDGRSSNVQTVHCSLEFPILNYNQIEDGSCLIEEWELFRSDI